MVQAGEKGRIAWQSYNEIAGEVRETVKKGDVVVAAQLIGHDAGFIEVIWDGGLLVFNLEEAVKAHRRGLFVLCNRDRGLFRTKITGADIVGSDER